MIAQTSLTGPRLMTVLYADIHGYTGLIERDEQGTLARLTRSLALIRSLTGDYGGSVVNTAGDGLVAVFESVQQALHFGIAIDPVGGEPRPDRVGLAVADRTLGLRVDPGRRDLRFDAAQAVGQRGLAAEAAARRGGGRPLKRLGHCDQEA